VNTGTEITIPIGQKPRRMIYIEWREGSSLKVAEDEKGATTANLTRTSGAAPEKRTYGKHTPIASRRKPDLLDDDFYAQLAELKRRVTAIERQLTFLIRIEGNVGLQRAASRPPDIDISDNAVSRLVRELERAEAAR
jgi:hypothetical protein